MEYWQTKVIKTYLAKNGHPLRELWRYSGANARNVKRSRIFALENFHALKLSYNEVAIHTLPHLKCIKFRAFKSPPTLW